jgi:hypothetical protein
LKSSSGSFINKAAAADLQNSLKCPGFSGKDQLFTKIVRLINNPHVAFLLNYS